MEPVIDKQEQHNQNVQAPREFFKNNGYVILDNALSKEQCKELSDYMFQMFDDSKTEKDAQCPYSDSIYGAPKFDELLQSMAKPIGDHIGKKLLPTYTYCRIYRPGEVLKMHKDRPSCEYSATLTLGYEGKHVWPIFMDEEKRIKLELEVGELVVYDGCNVAHWRPEYKGTWQVQLFLHYVDAEGQYKDHYADGRKEFGKPKTKDNMRDNFEDKEVKGKQEQRRVEWRRPIFNGVMLQSNDQAFPGYFPVFEKNFPEMRFTSEECQKIIDIAKEEYYDEAGIGGGADRGKIAKEVRDADLYAIHPEKDNMWIFDKLGNIVNCVNTMHFDYEITGITHSLQLLHYRHKPDEDTNGHYNWHIDSGPGHSALRKISISVQLTEDKYYEGGELEVFDHGGPVIGTKEQGSVHLFPSYMPHKVHPMKSGERWSLVIWVHGYKRFR